MVELNLKEMLEVGAHFGHQTRFWNPAMKGYIFGVRNGIHIIDLQKTLALCKNACDFVTKVVSEGGSVLFVGTKRQAQSIVQEEAQRAQMFFVNRRWLGGTLTNFRTIKASIDRLKELEKKTSEGAFDVLTKRERLGIEKEIQDFTRVLGGIKEMNQPPSLIFLIDSKKEQIALREASRLGIPVVALADTNCSPKGIDHLIPANDDAIKSIRFFCQKVADACLEGLAVRSTVMRQKVSGEETREESMSGTREALGVKGKAYVSQPEAFEGEAKESK